MIFGLEVVRKFYELLVAMHLSSKSILGIHIRSGCGHSLDTSREEVELCLHLVQLCLCPFPPQQGAQEEDVWSYSQVIGILRCFFLLSLFLPKKNWPSRFGAWQAVVLLAVGFLGGIFSSVAGSGVDICSFSVLSLLFRWTWWNDRRICISSMSRVNEKVSTPTSIVLMAINASSCESSTICS